MIYDWAQIYCKAGDGGEGDTSSIKLSARRVVGGGGDGGKGGDVILQVNPHLYDLNKFVFNKRFIASDGARGKRNNKKGAQAQNCIVNVPEGTLVFDGDENFIVDMSGEKKEFLLLYGGKGGRGNYKKVYSIPPEEGREQEIILDYRIVNDVAVIGFPNSGKTSLVNALTGKSFKVADYPFTTTAPAWAKAQYGSSSFVVMDTPPLKENSDERGLNKFLKHLYRTKIVLFISAAVNAYEKEFTILEREIKALDEELLTNKKIFYLLSKVDTIDERPTIKNVIQISACTGSGIEELKKKIIKYLTK
ncbi:MAG: 50S ribosome-binding GTPase [Candidatus Omnitrophica bacterium]|nr:50S ribosome-binding GTPase [Candidatus Omnitrophota bacterium]